MRKLKGPNCKLIKSPEATGMNTDEELNIQPEGDTREDQKSQQKVLSSAFFTKAYTPRLFRTSSYIDSLICGICLGIFQKPAAIIPCEHVFCNQCIKLYKRRTIHASCPLCRSPIIGFKYAKDIQAKIHKKKIKCPMSTLYNLHCPWVGSVEQLKMHITFECRKVLGAGKKGYPRYIFTKEKSLTKYACSLCQKILRDPVKPSGCAHLFCSYCLQTANQPKDPPSTDKSRHNDKCPVCLKSFKLLKSQSKVRSAINQQRVQCKLPPKYEILATKTCQWTGTAAEWDYHESVCSDLMEAKETLEVELPAHKRYNSNPSLQDFLSTNAQTNSRTRQATPRNLVPIQNSVARSCSQTLQRLFKILLTSLAVIFLSLLYYAFLATLIEPAILVSLLCTAKRMTAGYVIMLGAGLPAAIFCLIDTARSMSNTRNDEKVSLLLSYFAYWKLLKSEYYQELSPTRQELVLKPQRMMLWWLPKCLVYISGLFILNYVDKANYSQVAWAYILVVFTLGTAVISLILSIGALNKLRNSYDFTQSRTANTGDISLQNIIMPPQRIRRVPEFQLENSNLP